MSAYSQAVVTSPTKAADKRHRKTEKEEDEELLEAGDHSEETTTTITETPECNFIHLSIE